MKLNDPVAVMKLDGTIQKTKVTKLFAFDGLKRVEIEQAAAGDIVCLAGIEDITIGETIADPEHRVAIPPIAIDEPTVSMIFGVNTSPLAGRDGQYVTSRNLRDRLEKELLGNVSLRVEDTDAPEQLRVDRPRRAAAVDPDRDDAARRLRAAGVAARTSSPRRSTASEWSRSRTWSSTCPRTSRAWSSRMAGTRRGVMTKMVNHGSGRVRLEFRIPTRGLIGFRSQFLTDTKGTGIMNHLFAGWEPWHGAIPARPTGALVADRIGVATAYAIFNLQERGEIFIEPATPVYEGMIIGENARQNDMDVNVTKEKKQTNMRASTADEAIRLVPPRMLSLEQAIEFINDDELVEVTPKTIRLRKRILASNMRPKKSGD